MRINANWLIAFLIFFAIAVRIVPFNFPMFTYEEARIAYRGYALVTLGQDELGRNFPLIFNSLTDYQLPVVSYLVAVGELMFGKSDLGVRLPFIIIGVLLVLLVYQLSKYFTNNFFLQIVSGFTAAISPPLIFLSKIPNEIIILTFLLTLLFYLLLYQKSILFIILTMFLLVLTSKQAWFILPPFMLFTLIFYRNLWNYKRKVILFLASGLLIFLTFFIFLKLPQSNRSLWENNFSLFSDITIKNGIDKLRGQGVQSGWPPLIDRLLFNKVHFLTTGFLHWVSHISPVFYFGQLDKNGIINYSALGSMVKVLLVPFSLGLIYLIKRGERKVKLLMPYFLILTYPSFFVYPDMSLELIILTLPFMALIVPLGFRGAGKKAIILLVLIVAVELSANIFFLSSEYKKTTVLRPAWTKDLTMDIYERSKLNSVVVSDDIVSDIAPYIQWYTKYNSREELEGIAYAYKFRQYSLENIKMLGFGQVFTTCGENKNIEVFVSRRDLNKTKELPRKTIKVYQDSNGQEVAYLINNVCIK